MDKDNTLFEAEDLARWTTFGGFWGFIFYLLSLIGISLSHNNQPVRINARTALVGAGVQMASFIGFTAVFSLIQSLILKKSTSQIGRERIAEGTLERSVWVLGLGASLSSMPPFLIAINSMRTAERLTGEPVFDNKEHINWSAAAIVTALFSSLSGLAVARITSWVARDSRGGNSTN